MELEACRRWERGKDEVDRGFQVGISCPKLEHRRKRETWSLIHLQALAEWRMGVENWERDRRESEKPPWRPLQAVGGILEDFVCGGASL